MHSFIDKPPLLPKTETMNKLQFFTFLFASTLSHSAWSQDTAQDNVVPQTASTTEEAIAKPTADAPTDKTSKPADASTKEKNPQSADASLIESFDDGSDQKSETSTSQAAIPTDSPPPKELSLETFRILPNALRFSPEKNGVTISSAYLSYSVDKTEDLIISSVVFNGDTFKVAMTPVKNLTTAKGLPVSSDTNVLFLTAPMAMGQSGRIEVIGENGKTILKRQLKPEYFTQGKILAKALTPNFWNKVNSETQTSLLINIDKQKKSLLNPQRKGGFRICWIKEQNPYFSKVCSPYYRYSPKENAIIVQNQAGATKTYIDQKEVSDEGNLPLKAESIIRFLATTKSGFSFEFYSQVLPLQLVDFAFEETKNAYFFTGHTNTPTFPETKFFPGMDAKSFISKLQLNPTIAAPKDYWVSMLPKDKTFLILPGLGGGLFRYDLQVTKAPTTRSQITLTNPPTSTYSETPAIRGAFVYGGAKASTRPPGKVVLENKTNNFTWFFPAKIKGEEQEAAIITSENNQEFQAYYSLFRGYSGEFSFRIAGVLSSDLQLNILNEWAYNQWFETLFGWENYYVGKQRWGLSARQLSSLTTFQARGNSSTPLTLGLTTVDLKYRLTPGLWERDETWGLILGAENINVNKIKGAFGGAGFFWARSMPLIFDKIISWFPFMNYPKWVDLDLVYYMAPLAANVKNGSTPTYALNFHGKVLWKKNFFGEAGFGIKSYSYKTKKELSTGTQDKYDNVSVQALYGTVGLGFNF